MINSNLFLALGNHTQKNSADSAKKGVPTSTNVSASYKNILQETIAEVSRSTVRNTNNSGQTSSQVIRGDANNDGRVDEKDEALFVARMFAELDGKGDSVKINMKNADFSGDGKITPEDYSEFLHVYYQQQKDSNKTLKGDANGDGKVDTKDADLIELRTIGLGDESKFDMKAADMDGDGKITNTDLFKVRQLVREYESNVKTLQGDSNGDGRVDEADYKNIDDYLSGKESAEDFIRKNSDINGDGEVDNADLKSMRNILNGRPADWDESRLGDANGDGKINAKDAELITLSSIGLLGKNLKFDMNYADFDNDGEITPIDVAKINRLVNEKEKSVKTLQGDSNGDGRVDETDYQNIKDYLSARESTEDFVGKNSDVNGDGEVNEKDLQGVRNILDGRKIDWDESKRILGDVNGDGKVDMINDATTIMNYVNGKIQKKDFYWDNADVNHDGKIDMEDAIRIQKFYNGVISSLDQDITSVNPPFENAVITQQSNAYYDLYLTSSMEQISAYTQVRVIGMSSDGRALEVIFPTSDGGEARGWVSIENVKKYEPSVPKISLLEPERSTEPTIPIITLLEPEQSVAPSYQFFTATRETKAYADSTLTSQVNPYEKIYENGQFIILETTDNAYKVLYGTREGNKERWVSKDILVPVQNVQPVTPNYQTFTAARRVETYETADLNTKVNSYEFIPAGGQFFILEETDNAYKIQYNSTRDGLKDRWVSKDILVPNPESRPQPFISYETNVAFDLDTYDDSSMNKKIGKVFKGERVTVLGETENALQIRYGVGTAPNYTDFKTAWIPKNVPVPDDSDKLHQLIPIPNQSDTNNSNDIIALIDDIDNNSTDDSSRSVPPRLTEEVTDSARIFHVNPGYAQGGYIKEGGLYITNLNVKQNLNDEKPIVFDVYNDKDATGFVEYYDENGKFIRADKIAPKTVVIKDIDSFVERWKQIFGEIEFTTLEAPRGTHTMIVTNNQTESVYAYVYNMVDKFFAAQEIARDFKKVIKASDAFDDDVEVNRMLDDVREKFITSIIQTLQVNSARMALDNFSDEYDVAYETGKYILQTIGEEGLKDWALEGFDLQKAFEDSVAYAISNLGTFALDEVKGIAWGTCKDLLKGNPAILGLEALKATGSVLDYLSKFMTEKQLENVDPMVFRFEV